MDKGARRLNSELMNSLNKNLTDVRPVMLVIAFMGDDILVHKGQPRQLSNIMSKKNQQSKHE